ncbi:MAG: biotin transporter BioY [Candidatus Omnitrophota bacterium]
MTDFNPFLFPIQRELDTHKHKIIKTDCQGGILKIKKKADFDKIFTMCYSETMNNALSSDIHKIVYTSLFAALTIVGSYIYIPIPFGPIPLILSNFFIMLAGLLLPRWWACGSVGLYLFSGALGLPVFAGGSGGIVHFIGPTGGYLIGYMVGVLVIASIVAFNSKSKSKKKRSASAHSWFKDAIALILGLLTMYCLGVSWLKVNLALSWDKAIALGVLPFLIGDSIKLVAAVSLAGVLRPRIPPQVTH